MRGQFGGGETETYSADKKQKKMQNSTKKIEKEERGEQQKEQPDKTFQRQYLSDLFCWFWMVLNFLKKLENYEKNLESWKMGLKSGERLVGRRGGKPTKQTKGSKKIFRSQQKNLSKIKKKEQINKNSPTTSFSVYVWEERLFSIQKHTRLAINATKARITLAVANWNRCPRGNNGTGAAPVPSVARGSILKAPPQSTHGGTIHCGNRRYSQRHGGKKNYQKS